MPTSRTATYLVPTLEFDEFLKRALNSLKADQSEFGAGVLVILDGSLDDVNVPRWVREEGVELIATGARRGVASALNLGAEFCKTTYIARLDSDDLSFAGRLIKQVDYLESHPNTAVVATCGVLIDEFDRWIGEYPSVVGGDVRTTLLRRNPVIHSSVLFRRDDFLSWGGYDPGCIRMQDYELLLRASAHGAVAILPDRLVGYRIHGGQTSRQASGFGRLMRVISRRRRNLARVLGRGVAAQCARDAVFTSAQLLRYAGLRRPRYELAVRPPRAHDGMEAL